MQMEEAQGHIALITGATGFIGGRLAERLAGNGQALRLFVRDRKRLSAVLCGIGDVVEGDLSDPAAVAAAVRGASVIYHCAANVRTWDADVAYYSTNVGGVENLLNAIRTENPSLSRLVHLSSVDVYGFPHTPCDETAATAASGFGYSDTKRIGDHLVQDFSATHGVPCTIIRPANVIGPGSEFIRRIGDALKSGVMLTVNGGRANAGFVYVDTLVDYMLWAASAPRAAGQIYNVRDPYDVSWADFIAVFRKAIGGNGLVVNLPFPAADTAATATERLYRLMGPAREPFLHRLLVRIFGRTCGHSAEKIHADAGWRGTVGFEEAMEKSIDWFLRGKPA